MMARYCCVCNKKIGGWDGYYPLDKNIILCTECGHMTTSEVNVEEAVWYFSELYKKNIVDKNIQEKIAHKIRESHLDENTRILENLENEQKNNEQLRNIRKHITTGLSFDGYEIVEYLGIISGDVVVGTGFLSELNAGISDVFGTKADGYVKKMRMVKRNAVDILVKEAIEMGGNAIIGVDFDYVTFNNNMIGISANGTAVTIKKPEQDFKQV